MAAMIQHKYMTEGEAGLAIALVAAGLLCPCRRGQRAGRSVRLPRLPGRRRRAWLGLRPPPALRQRARRPAPREIGGKPNYNFGPVKFAAIASMVWGIAGFLVGVIIAFQLWAPELNLGLPYTTFGRLRPLHTSAVIFAFGGNVLIATSLYVVQRTCRVRLAGDLAPWFVVLGYNFFIVIAGNRLSPRRHPV